MFFFPTAGTVFTINGIKIPYDRNLISRKIGRSLKKGTYEQHEAKYLDKIIGENERILELGAGIGFISSLCSKSGKAEKIRAFEANPDLIPFIERVHALNGISNVEIVNSVLSNSIEADETVFYKREDFWASSLSETSRHYVDAIKIKVRNFDDEIESFKPTLIICDIEGGELDLLCDCNLSGVEKIYLELHQDVIGALGVKKIFDTLSKQMFRYDPVASNGPCVLFLKIATENKPENT